MRKRFVKRVILISTALFVIFISCGFSAAQETGRPDLEFARKAFNDGFYDIAQSRLETFLKSYPGSESVYEAHSLLGQCYVHLKMPGRAQNHFQLILETPAAGRYYDIALYWTGETSLQEEDYKKALEYYQKVIDGYPSSKYMAFALYSQGWTYYKLGLLKEAASRFGETAERYPFENVAAEAQFRLAECRYLLGDYGESEKALKAFIEKYPLSEKAQEAHYLSGEALFHQAKYRAAVGYFERALSISPDAKWAHLALYRIARASFEIGDYAASAAYYAKCLTASTDPFINASCEAGLARNYLRMGKTEEALKQCDAAIRKYDDTGAAAEVYYIKIKILYNKARYDDAGSLCKEAIYKFPKSHLEDDFHYELGWIYVMQSRPDDAVKEFLWIENNSGDINLSAGALCKIADIYLEKNDYRRSVENYDLVLTKYSDSMWADYAQYRIADVSFDSGRYDQAIIAYRTMLVNYPNSALRHKAMAQLGLSYFKKKDYEQAALELERLLAEDTKGRAVPQAGMHLACALFNLGRYKDALQLFRKIAESKDSSVEEKMLARYHIGWCYHNVSDESRAVDEFSRFLKEYPDSPLVPDARMRLGEYYASKGRFDLALARYEEVISKYPESGQAKSSCRKIANIFKDRKDFDGAIMYLKKALTSENNELNAQIQYEIGECHESKGEADQAVREYLKVPYLYSKSPFWTVRAELKCAQALERLDRLDEAKKLYEKLAGKDVQESGLAKKRLEWLKRRDHVGSDQ